jgi:hypothetical protein
MAEDRIPRKEVELKDDRKVISPPILVDPAYACSNVVKVDGFIPFATIEVEINGVIAATQVVAFPDPNGALIYLSSPLVPGQTIRARQIAGGATSPWSNSITVKDHQQDYPAGPPRPDINPDPVYECGSRTGVGNLLIGANVWITADGTEVGRVNGCNDQQGVNVAPDYSINQEVIAQSDLCGDKSPRSSTEISKAYPYPLPAPAFDNVYEGSQQIRIANIANGARVNLKRDGVNQGTSGCWGGSLLWNLSSPVVAGTSFEATQSLCSGPGPSPTGTTTAQPCGNLPAPSVYPVQIGDSHITLTAHVWGAIIKVYINNVKVGQGSGSVILLTQTVKWGDVILVGQELGSCKSNYLTVINPLCVAPPISFDPSALNLFPVGNKEYSQGDAKGSVYYPAEEDGTNTKFNERLGNLKRSPIVFLAHGNHSTSDPSYLGYDYFQRQLARMGFIAVSVDCNATNGVPGSVFNIEERVDLIIQSISLFQTFDTSSGNTFFNKIDFAKLGLMGHSRGGDAVVMTPEVISLSGVTIQAVLALAPTDFRAYDGEPDALPKKFNFMTILPAGDGDVWSNDGARFYDKSKPAKIKCQLYVYYANHNFFNRQWLVDDGSGPPVMMRFEHEQILSTYGCAFFRTLLMNHNSTMKFLTGHALPAGARAENVHLAVQKTKQVTVDDHEQTGGIATNTMGQSTSQSGLVAQEYPFNQYVSGTFNNSFFGNSIGMVIKYDKQNATFGTKLKPVQNLKGKEIWIRASEIYSGTDHVNTGFQLGVTDANGTTAWVDSNGVGGIPDPYPHLDGRKTMLKTLRFRATCFSQSSRRLNIEKIVKISIRCNRALPHPALAFDDLQIVS